MLRKYYTNHCQYQEKIQRKNQRKAMMNKLENKVGCNRIEGMDRVSADQKEDIEVLFTESTELREKVGQNRENIVNIEAKIKELKEVIEGPSQLGYRELLVKEIAEFVPPPQKKTIPSIQPADTSVL